MIRCRFGKDEPAEFDSISFQSDALDEWLHLHEVKASLQSEPRKCASISYVPPEKLLWKLNSGEEVTFSATWTAPSLSSVREAKITQETWVEFKFPRRLAIKDALDCMFRFNDLASFACDQDLPIQAIAAYHSDTHQNFGETSDRVPIEIYFNADFSNSVNIKRITTPFVFIPFSKIRPKFDEVLSKWLSCYTKFPSAFNLYFATNTTRRLYVDNRYLMLVQAIEALHRSMSSTTRFEDGEYSQLCELLRSAAPGKFATWLAPRLKYGNEPTLRQRLKSMFRGFEGVFGGKKYVKSLISRIVIARNYLTHYDPELKGQADTDRPMHKLCVTLEILFQLHLCRLVGFEDSEILNLCG